MQKAYEIEDNISVNGTMSVSTLPSKDIRTEDTISSILLRATSLFKYERYIYRGTLASYAGTLKLRAKCSGFGSHWKEIGKGKT